MTRRDESGAALVLALFFVSLFGLWMSSILSFGDSSMRATQQLRIQRKTVYAATGATDAALQFVRWDAGASDPTHRGAFGTDCPTFQTTLNGLGVVVQCTTLTEVFDIDRTVAFSTLVGGVERVRATVIYRDSTADGAMPAVDVATWRYVR